MTETADADDWSQLLRSRSVWDGERFLRQIQQQSSVSEQLSLRGRYPITLAEFMIADVTDSMLDGYIASSPSAFASRVGEVLELPDAR